MPAVRGTVVDVPAVGDDSTGARIAQYRKLRSLTQRGLAMRAHVSYSTLTKVESGHAIASPAVLAALARALSVNVTQLTGQPYVTELREAGLEELVEPLRLALDAYDLGPTGDVAPRDPDQVEADVRARCHEVMVDGLVGKVAAELPGLLDELGAMIDNPNPRTWRALAHAYRCVQHVASKWGYRDLAVVALDRMGWAAEKGDDALVAALRFHERAHEHLRAGQYRHGQTLLTRAEQTADSAPHALERTALLGQVHLAASIHTARSGDDSGTDDHLQTAAELAQRAGEVPHVFWLSFGPTNVALHQVATLIERDRHDEAVTTADSLPLPHDWHPTRLAHHAMDLSRSHVAMGRPGRAMECLDDARRLAPQITRFHPTTRQTVEHLLATRRRVPQPLASYARWVGL
jgi:transcriptional regulator with XRE-family HTH domain